MPVKKLYIAIALCTVLLLGFITTSVISYFAAQRQLSTRIAEETLPLTSDNIYSEIEQDLLRSVLISSLMAHDTFLRDWTLEGEQEPRDVVRYLAQIQDKYDTTTAFFVSERTRRYYHPDGVLAEVQRDDPQDAWYFRVREMDQAYEVNVDRDTANPQRVTIFVNYRVTDGNGELLGATGIGLSVDTVAELIEQYERQYGRKIFFINDSGRITLHGEGLDGPDNIRKRAGLSKVATQLLSSPSAQTRYTHPDGGVYYVNSRDIPELGWSLVVQQSKSDAQQRILASLALNVGIAVAVALLVAVVGWFTVRGYQVRLEAMATTDNLTGTTNRQVFDLIFDQVARTARRSGTGVSLLAIDIDRFKPINDSKGHAAGDAVLRALSSVFREHLRESDSVCRWGGDEFIVLLPDCRQADAHSVADKLRAAIAERPIRHGNDTIHVTVSVGVAEYRAEEHLPSLVARADDALYAAKAEGRDRVTAG